MRFRFFYSCGSLTLWLLTLSSASASTDYRDTRPFDARLILRSILFEDSSDPALRALELSLKNSPNNNQQVRTLMQLAVVAMPDQLELAKSYLKQTETMSNTDATTRRLLDTVKPLVDIPKAQWVAGLNGDEYFLTAQKKWSIKDAVSSSLQAQIANASQQNDHHRVVALFRQLISADPVAYPVKPDSAREYVGSLRALGLRTELQSFLEDYSAHQINTPEGSWAFVELFSSCVEPVDANYRASMKYLKRLYRQAADEGMRAYIIALLEHGAGYDQVSVGTSHFSAMVEFGFSVGAHDLVQRLAIEKWTQPDHRWNSSDLQNIARSFWRTGDKFQAAKFLSKAVQLEHDQKQRRRLAKWFGDLLAEMRLHEQAHDVYQYVLKKRSSSLVRWAQFWNSYLSGHYEKAQTMLDKSHQIGRRDRYYREYVLYWKARIAANEGKTLVARNHARRLMSRYPGSYYALMAQSRWGDKALTLDQVVQPADQDFSYDAEEYDADGLAPQIEASLESDDLWFLEDERTDADDLNLNFQNIHAQVTSVNESKNESHDYLFDVAEKTADAVGLPSGLVKAIMRAESGYRVNATSPVGARGLMQIMPRTGALIARELDDRQFGSGSLYDPSKNITYGSFYLKYLLDYYRGTLPLAIAAYNAGPHAVDRWINRCNNCEIDEFIEWIPYRETRRYVKDVIRYHHMELATARDLRPWERGLEMPTDLLPFRDVF